MNDILDDLREPEWRGPMQHCRAWTELDALQDRAAAEIARLRSCRDDLVVALEDLRDAVKSGGYPHKAMARADAALKRAKEE